MRFKIDWASLIVGRTFTIFALFYFVFEGNFQVQATGRVYIWRGDLTEGFLRYEFGGLNIFGGAYTWRDLFSEFYGNSGRVRDQPGLPDTSASPHLPRFQVWASKSRLSVRSRSIQNYSRKGEVNIVSSRTQLGLPC